MYCAKIDWDNTTWKNNDNIKSYIRKFGNPDTNLSEMTHDELLHLAKCTEKACAITNEENQPCSQCNEIIAECHCVRCDNCYCVQIECKCNNQYANGHYVHQYANDNRNVNNDEECNRNANDDKECTNVANNANDDKTTFCINNANDDKTRINDKEYDADNNKKCTDNANNDKTRINNKECNVDNNSTGDCSGCDNDSMNIQYNDHECNNNDENMEKLILSTKKILLTKKIIIISKKKKKEQNNDETVHNDDEILQYQYCDETVHNDETVHKVSEYQHCNEIVHNKIETIHNDQTVHSNNEILQNQCSNNYKNTTQNNNECTMKNNNQSMQNSKNYIIDTISNIMFPNEDIESLAYKIKLKLFILDKTNKYKNKTLNKDILRLIKLIVLHHNVEINELDSQSIVKLFAKIETLDKKLQLQILKNIMYCLN